MFTSIFDESSKLTFLNVSIILFVSLCCGLGIAILHKLTHKERKNNILATTLVVLPPLVGIIINLISSDIAMAFSLAGIFTLIRFRSEPADSKDIVYVLLAAGLGLACGLGFVLLAIVIAIFISAVLTILYLTKFGQAKSGIRLLKIVIPENLEFDNAFDEVLAKYCNSYELQKTRTCDYGSLFELTYVIDIKDLSRIKALMDEIRIINSNLDISISLKI